MKLFPLLALPLVGCAVAQQAPSLKYCDMVKYERTGREVNITAHCFEAVDSAILPAAIPIKP